MPNFTAETFLKKRNSISLRGVLPITTMVMIGVLLILSIITVIYRSGLGKGERIVEALCSGLIIIPGIATLFSRRNPLHYARFIMFSLLMVVIILISLSLPSFHPPSHLIIVSSLWALPLPLPMLHRGTTLWLTVFLDLLLLGAFFPYMPIFLYASFLLLMCVPLTIITWARGWQGGVLGAIPLFWGLLDTRITNYREAGLFLLIWAPILGVGTATLGLFVNDYRRLREVLDKLEIFQQMNKEVLSKESLKEGARTVLKHITRNIFGERYLLKLEGVDIEPLSFSSSPPIGDPGRGRTRREVYTLRRKFSITDVEGEIVLERTEKFSPAEEELLADMLEEVTPAMEKLLYLEKAVEMAISDSLTFLANRAYFLYWLREDINRAKRYKTPLSLLLLDIDGFKIYNDTHGHNAGDEVLRRIGEKLKSLIRRSDIAARYGGDEFVILFPYANLEEAMRVSERIRESIKLMKIPLVGDTYLTLSGGLVMYKEGEEPRDFLGRADALLYRAKEKGGDRIETE